MRLLEVPESIGTLLMRPGTFWVVVALFVLIGVVMSMTLIFPYVDGNGHVPYVGTVAPDEHRHIANILYYAGRPVLAGPVLHDIPTSDLAMGEMLRFPSYFYYYVMSFPVKPFINLELPYWSIVVFLRLVNLAVGVVGLIVLRRLLRTMGLSEPAVVLTVVVLAFTGRYLWQSAAVSYDAPAMTLFLACLLFCAQAIREPSWSAVTKAFILAGWTVVFKYTFVPFVLIAIVSAVVIGVRQHGIAGFRQPVRRLVAGVRHHVVGTVAWTASLLLATALVVERLVQNLVVYRAFDPDCSQLHTHAQCLSYAIYARNYQAQRGVELLTATGNPPNPPDLLQFAGSWATTYFQSIFFYRDRSTAWSVRPLEAALGSLMIVVAIVVTLIAARAVLRNRALLWGGIVAAVYTFAMFVFNLRTLLQFAQEYAFSGRYLLPVLPLIYAFLVVAALKVWRRIPPTWRVVMVVPLLLLALVVAVLYCAPVAFFEYARTPDWYTRGALEVLPRWVTGYDGTNGLQQVVPGGSS